MGTYWDDFIEEYKDKLYKISLVRILKAFWHYSNNGKSKCDEIMNR